MIRRAAAAQFIYALTFAICCHTDALGQIEVELDIAIRRIRIVQQHLHRLHFSLPYSEVFHVQLFFLYRFFRTRLSSLSLDGDIESELFIRWACSVLLREADIAEVALHLACLGILIGFQREADDCTAVSCEGCRATAVQHPHIVVIHFCQHQHMIRRAAATQFVQVLAFIVCRHADALWQIEVELDIAVCGFRIIQQHLHCLRLSLLDGEVLDVEFVLCTESAKHGKQC